MLYSSLTSTKKSRFSRLFTLIIIVSVLVPNLYIGGIQRASAQEAEGTVSASSASETSLSSTDKSSDTESNSGAISNDPETTSVSSTNKGSGKSSQRPIKVTPKNGALGGNGGESDLRGVTTGSITVCTIFVNQNGAISRNAASLPDADFSIRVLPRVSPPFMVWDLAFRSQDFVPNQALVSSTNDAQCFTREGLPLREEGYLYYQEVIDPANEWAVPRYNDQHVIMVDDLNDFFAYSGQLFDNDPANDDFRDLNADGHIGLTPERPNRTLVILNRFTETIQNQPPVLSIVGPNPTNLTVGQVFTDQGATALDPEEGDISLRVNATGTVDTNVVGTYTITYTVTDTGGLSDTDTRIVNVLPETIENLGSLTVCKMIISTTEGTIAKSGAGVPAGHFEVDIAERVDIASSTIRTATFDVSTFIPNERLLPTSPDNDAQCITFNNLPIDESNLLPAYFYSQERITGDTTGEWGTPGYNDQFTIPVDDAEDFFAYTPQFFDQDPSNDGLRNVNSDGHVGLTLEHPNRRLVILNRFTPDTGGPTNTAPEITVLGANPVTITVGDSYVDAGATAYDAQEFDITSRIVTTGSVNTGVVGTYTITYFVEDLQHLSDTETRTVHVIPRGGGDFGSVTVCKMIVDSNGNIATSTAGLPAGRFDITIGETLDISSTAVATTTFNTQSFTPNRTIFGTENNAECVTINNLLLDNTVTPPGLPSYFYSQEMITGAGTTTWGTPRYSDQFVNNVDELSDLFVYTPQFFDNDPSNDGLRNVESDGHIGLTSERPDRTLIVLNTYTADNNPPANTPPVITVTGNNPFTITVGNSYTDQGATADDAQDGNLTDRIVTTGTSTVDTNVVGTYTVTYFVEDNGGLTDTKTRTVNVVPADGGNGGGGGGGGGGSRHRSGGRVLGETTEPAACYYLRDHLRRDWNNDPVEVLKLQYFLKNLEGFSNLETTGVFDQATFDAVSAFQIRYFDDILAPWGHTTSTGFVYILTKKKVNEIFCQKAFPVTTLEQEEIDNFRSFLTGLRARGINVDVDGSMMTDETKDDSMMDGTDYKDVMNGTDDAMEIEKVKSLKDRISDLVGLRSMNFGGSFGSEKFKAAASAIFSFPADRNQVLESIYFLLIAIIAVYLLTEIAVGSMNTENMSKYRVWKRKAIGYTIGLAISIVFAVWYHVFGIVAPLLALLVVSILFWIWAANKKIAN